MIPIKKLLLIPLILLCAIGLNAQSFGTFGSAVFIKKNGSLGTYNVTGSGANIIGPGGPSYTGDLGTYDQNSGTLVLGGAEVKTFKDPGTSVCGAYYNYSIHPVGQTAPYTEMALPLKATCSNGTFTDGLGPCNGNDQKWNKENAEIDLTNKCPGTYVMDVYYRVPGSSTSATGCNENKYIGSPTSPAGSMTFTIVGTPLSSFMSAPLPVCQGSPANLSVTSAGGSSPYTYYLTGPNGFTSSSPSTDVTTPGVYTLTTTDKCGTTTTTQTTVSFKPKPSAPSVACAATICPAGTATLTASGCNGTVTWSNGATGSTTTAAPGTYTATCTIDECTSSPSAPVTVSIKLNGNIVYTDNYSNLAPGATKCYTYMARYLPCGSNVCVEVSASVIGSDYNPGNNTCSACKPMTCVCFPPPYDPNYKDASPKRTLEGGIFESDEWLTYTVHCQNDGLGIAHNVVMIDTIDISKFDINSLQVLSSKDPVQFRRIDGHTVAFDFIGVGLTSSFDDLPRSQTEVIFKIKRLTGQPVGTELTNKVGIYFDHEKVVETDLAFSKIVAPCDPSVTKTGMVLTDQYVPKGSTSENPFTLKDYDGVITGWEMSTDPTFNTHVSKVDNYTQVLNYKEVVDNATYFRALVQTGGCPSAPSKIAAIYPICSGNLVKNGSFEDPALTGKTWALKAVQGWTNTVDNNTIEIQRDLNVTATDGAQYAELNGNNYGNIYQDINVSAGKLIRWNVDHRARSAANEVIKVTLSAPDGSNAQTVSHKGSLTAWQPVGGTYQAAEGQTVVRIRIVFRWFSCKW